MHQPVLKEQLKQRRHQARQQRRVRFVKSLWRFVCMSGIVTGLGWVVTQSDWKISRAEQIQIRGNQYLSDQTIRSMLAISYPKLVLELAPAQLITKLIEQGSVVSAKVDRGLLPPRLIVQVQDLPPVAEIMQDESTPARLFVNENGYQVPIASYRSTVWQSLPKLRLRVPTAETCPHWNQLYRVIQTSPVAIGIIDCRNPQNLILQTEVGKVRLGTSDDRSRLVHQIQQLDRLRNWQQDTNTSDVDSLDLENPSSPKLQLKPGKTTTFRPILN